MRAPVRTTPVLIVAALLSTAPPALAGPPTAAAPASSPVPDTIKPAAERNVSGSTRKAVGRGVVSDSGSSGQPAIRGPKLPEALRKALQVKLDARVDADLAKSKELRAEAIDLLSKFVAETPREAREMPEALVRLSELQWENERERFVDRFAVWDKKPVDQRGPAPELDYRVARDLLARVLKEYPWFEQTDLALYVDGFLAFEQGKEDEARDRFERILKDYPRSRFTPDAHMAKAKAIFNGRFAYAAPLAGYEKALG